ncbi:MAG TPA: alkaline phosphatase [Anaerolineales bacterium]|nr:alkaline phosphatase [Anaerolineales bacterium]
MISPAFVQCLGVVGDCIQVKFSADAEWSVLQGSIEGFRYEPGYQYMLLVEELASQNATAKATKGRYKLIEIQEKTKRVEVDSASLDNAEWALTAIGNIDQPQSVSGFAPVNLNFDLAEGRVTGRAACNNFLGTFSVDYALMDMDVSLVGMTRMACREESMNLQQEFFNILDQVSSYSVEGQELVMFTPGGQVLTFVSGTPGIILFIGDGMGPDQRMAATWSVYGQGGTLVMDGLPISGQATNASANQLITDSAAAATAMSTGVQTNNGVIGLDPLGNSLTTILEHAQAKGWATGLVTTVPLSHATPAAFAAHVPSRTDMVAIAQQMMDHKVNVLLGGGEDYFYSTSTEGCYPGMGYQENNLVQEAVDFGYSYVCTSEQLAALDLTGMEYLLGLFDAEGMQRPIQPDLAEMTSAAMEVLSQDPDGFFLMVEAGQIDWAGHNNVASDAITSTVGLDAAVTLAESFLQQNPNTLLIVAADHETGGMSLNLDGVGSAGIDGPFDMPDGTNFWVDWSTTGHTDTPVPVTAFGRYADLLAGEYHLTHLFDTMNLFFSRQRP